MWNFFTLISFYCRDVTFSTLLPRDVSFSTFISFFFRDGTFFCLDIILLPWSNILYLDIILLPWCNIFFLNTIFLPFTSLMIIFFRWGGDIRNKRNLYVLHGGLGYSQERERVLAVSDRSVACFPQGYPKGKDDSCILTIMEVWLHNVTKSTYCKLFLRDFLCFVSS